MKIVTSILAVVITVLLISPPVFADGYDAPLAKRSLALPNAKNDPYSQPMLTCFYYPQFMLKQTDLGEKGASAITLVPVTGSAEPACTPAKAAGERTFNSQWPVNVSGVKGGYIILESPNAKNGAAGFQIFDASARKLFEDASVGKPAVTIKGPQLDLRYRRAYAPGCSLLAAPQPCWRKVVAAIGLRGEMPDCRAYERSADLSVVYYEVVSTLMPLNRPVTVVTGQQISCGLAE